MIRTILIIVIFSTNLSNILADKPIQIGILSFRSLEHTQQQWQALADYLGQAIPQHAFRIVPLYYPDLDAAATANQLDFILTNPEHYVILRQSTGMTAIATLMPLAEDHPVNQFGGLIFSSAKRGDLQNLTDLAGKHIASPDKESFGGFIMQQWELYKRGIEAANFIFTGMPHDNVVNIVLQGKADAGFVRSGILEALVKEGKLKMDDVKIINPQQHPGFPQMTSTPLYPEWPFAAMPATEASLIKAVSLALLNLDNQNPTAQAAHIFGFSPPGDYSSVEAIMLRLNLHPQELKNINIQDVYFRYRQPVWIALFSLLLILMLSIQLFRINRRLRRSTLKYHLVADYTSDWEYWINPQNEIVYMSPSCRQVTGYSAQEFKQRPRLLIDLIHEDDKADFLQHWQNHEANQPFGDIEFRIKARDGATHWIHHLCQPVFDNKKRYQGIRASNRDVTIRKKIELDLALHDAALKACAEAIIITDANAIIQWVNPAFCTLSGYTALEAIGHSPNELIKSGKQDETFYQHLWETIQAGGFWRGEIINKRKNGDLYHEQISITPVYGCNKAISHFVAVKQDISDRKQTEEKIKQLAFYDPLTGLANRRLLLDRLEHAIGNCRRSRQYGALLFLDLDHFKQLNDNYGHDTGDQLLIEVAHRIKTQVREQDTVARLGGDEFVVLLVEQNPDPFKAGHQAELVAQKIHDAIGEAFHLNIHNHEPKTRYHLTVSIGISLFLDDTDNADKILKQADIAMYDAKHNGRNTIRNFKSGTAYSSLE